MKRRSFLGLLAGLPALRLIPSAPAAAVVVPYPEPSLPGGYVVLEVCYGNKAPRVRVYGSKAEYLDGFPPVRECSRDEWQAEWEAAKAQRPGLWGSTFTLPRHV